MLNSLACEWERTMSHKCPIIFASFFRLTSKLAPKFRHLFWMLSPNVIIIRKYPSKMLITQQFKWKSRNRTADWMNATTPYPIGVFHSNGNLNPNQFIFFMKKIKIFVSNWRLLHIAGQEECIAPHVRCKIVIIWKAKHRNDTQQNCHFYDQSVQHLRILFDFFVQFCVDLFRYRIIRLYEITIQFNLIVNKFFINIYDILFKKCVTYEFQRLFRDVQWNDKSPSISECVVKRQKQWPIMWLGRKVFRNILEIFWHRI